MDGETALAVPLWDGLSEKERAAVDARDEYKTPKGTFTVDEELARTALSIRDIDEALTRRQYGYASVDDYYAAASSDQR
eukprot:CAMPEP_0182593244 /NCGR_PEP_ID=MMETSP1324-20130603/77611_1 /TAXON_ID=236786 /ORGANISM="Florenciella sp., Strain RCC1587" /LENGTH=78 /DNA_ID=CAMNT_0024810689 /DNA_START=1 /DNA_END=234 /DNA_ORIENTATION=+